MMGDQAMMYISVVHGRNRNPSSPQTQLEIAASGLSPKIHQKKRAIRGPMPPARRRTQHTRASLGDRRPRVNLRAVRVAALEVRKLRLVVHGGARPAGR